MSTYPGNTSLSTAVKDRVVSTFEQAIELYRAGRTDEVVSGCNLILQMDPLFDPAKRLLEKARNPGSPVDVANLMKSGGGDALQQAREAMRARDFDRVVQLTTDILTNDLMNDEARILSDEAREKMEASPFVDQFVRKVEQHLTSGNMSGARSEIEKARALDSSHPGVARMDRQIADRETKPGSFDASSFVVDNPPPAAAGRGAAQASDFGFTFEEDKGGAGQQPSSFANFSFDSPSPGAAAPSKPAAPAPKPAAPAAAPPPVSDSPFAGGFSFDTPVTSPAGGSPFGYDTGKPAPAGEFDFSTASIETSPDDQRKVEQYLADGDRAFQTGDYQGAIDLWSRIFLIDVTNEAASDRIEKAKGLRRDVEQKLDSVTAAGIQAFERRDFMTARARFNEVLDSDKHNPTALDYIERIDSASSSASIPMPSPSASYESSVLDDDSESGSYSSGSISPPAPSAAGSKPKPAPSRTVAVPEKKRSLGPVIAAIAAVVVLAGGWFAWTKFSQPSVTPAVTQGAVARAGVLAQQGKYDQAITMLQDIKPGDPQYDAALAMIADLQAKKQRAATMIDGRPAAAYYDEKIAAATAAVTAHDYLAAKAAFEQAMRVKPLPPELKSSYEAAAQQAAKLDSARTLFAERKFQDVIASLQPMLLQDPQNASIRRMMIDAHFNLGAVALQEERLADAAREFDEVLAANPSDELARRSRDLAQRYDGQTKDLLYRIYVKYLPLRQAA